MGGRCPAQSLPRKSLVSNVRLDGEQRRLPAVLPEYFRQLMALQPWQGRTLFPFPAVRMHNLED